MIMNNIHKSYLRVPAILFVVIIKMTILISRSRVVKLSAQSLIQNFFLIYSHKFGHAL